VDQMQPPQNDPAELIRVRGLVQGVGLRPTVWRLARRHGLGGWVSNDGEGVSILVHGPESAIAGFVDGLCHEPPPLARIDSIERTRTVVEHDDREFRIVASRAAGIRTGVLPDAALCEDCRQEILDPNARRHRYPFANCTNCGPRLTIIQTIPYDRAATTMRAFQMCEACAAEYADPADRRFHAQPIACAACGPRVWLQPGMPGEAVTVARELLLAGRILAVKALGGFHLACDATNTEAVMRLRQKKRRDAKPFALMARDLAVVEHFAQVTADAAAALRSTAAPIVVLDALQPDALPGVAPGLSTLGFMLPSTPLHCLLLQDIDRPLVMTSGNLSDEPQCIGNDEASQRLNGIAEYFLLHDRDIARRVDDSIVRVMNGEARMLRRARGYAPAPLRLPDGFADAAPVLAMGGELKNTFCLLRDGKAVLSHHMGDLENAPTFADYQRSIEQYGELFAHSPQAIAVDRHPDYLSTKFGSQLGSRVIRVQHHHAHLAACMAENGVALDAGPVLGIILDGLGWGDDNTIWGGEFLLGDYRRFQRLACFKPAAMPGGVQAIHEPWRNTLAQVVASMGWSHFMTSYGQTELARYLADKPVPLLTSMIERGVNAPLTSSCGRLFDAVAAAVGLCRDRARYEGQAAMMLETVAAEHDCGAYPFAIVDAGEILRLDPAPLWHALLDDLATTPAAVIAARFHAGLAAAIANMVEALGHRGAVALSGGVFQNKLLFELVSHRLQAMGQHVLAHRIVPANDGGLALGQTAIAAARMISGDEGA
jgi:hydrogenase maturation protein HypF